jgi:hypothetical protein
VGLADGSASARLVDATGAGVAVGCALTGRARVVGVPGTAAGAAGAEFGNSITGGEGWGVGAVTVGLASGLSASTGPATGAGAGDA